jgi:hypothetical protein
MVYVLTPSGTLDASWIGIGGRHADDGQLAIWEGTKWELVGNTGAIPDASTTVKGIVQLADAAAITAGTPGLVVDAAQLKAAGGGVHVGTMAPPSPKAGALWWNSSNQKLKVYNDSGGFGFWQEVNPDATTTAKGIVQLADAAAITAGTAGRVVDAAQLKANVPTIADATTTVKGIVQLADAAAITAGTAGRVVDAAQLKDAITFGTGTCRAWVNFNGTGTVAIRASYNVSSITDNGAGDYRVNFTSALSDANYAIAGFTIGTTSATLGVISARNTFTPNAGYCSILAGRTDAGNANDVHHAHAAFFR